MRISVIVAWRFQQILSTKNKNKTWGGGSDKKTEGIEINQRQINWEAFTLEKPLELQVRLAQNFKVAIIYVCKNLEDFTLKNQNVVTVTQDISNLNRKTKNTKENQIENNRKFNNYTWLC